MGCTYLPSVLIIAMYFDKKRGIATGITMAGSGVGAFVFAPFTEYLLSIFDWRFTMIILGCIVLQCGILGSLMRPVPPTKLGKNV
jgi:MFS family permease